MSLPAFPSRYPLQLLTPAVHPSSLLQLFIPAFPSGCLFRLFPQTVHCDSSPAVSFSSSSSCFLQPSPLIVLCNFPRQLSALAVSPSCPPHLLPLAVPSSRIFQLFPSVVHFRCPPVICSSCSFHLSPLAVNYSCLLHLSPPAVSSSCPLQLSPPAVPSSCLLQLSSSGVLSISSI